MQNLLSDLQALLPESALSKDPKDLFAYAHSKYQQFAGNPHAVVVHVRSTSDVVDIVTLCGKHRVPIVVYSGGTSLEGNLSGAEGNGSICLDLSRMNKILDINVDDSDVICEAGVVWNVLNETLKQKNIPLFFPLDPAPGATIGGMIAQGCSGTNAVRYGTARGEYILNLTAVLASGQVIKTRQRARKSSAGFDLTKLLIGAEGTLGIVTEATLRLTPTLPTSVAVVSFPDVRKATAAVTDILKLGAALQCAELVDDIGIKAMNTYGKSTVKWRETDTIFFNPLSRSTTEQGITTSKTKRTRKLSGPIGRMACLVSYRHTLVERDSSLMCASQFHVCLILSPECANKNLIAPISGHVGDGNFHAFILYKDDQEFKAVQEVVDSMIHKAIALDGTCTGEHGVGLGKKMYLRE